MVYEYERGDDPILSYGTTLPFLSNKIKFSEGLNIIVGPNGTGKTTLLKSLALLFFCEQQGYPKINGLSDIGSMFIKKSDGVPFSDIVKHNGLPVLYNNRFEKGHFDDDNFSDSLDSIMVQNNFSSGQVQSYEWNMFAEKTKKSVPYKELTENFKKNVNGYYKRVTDIYMKWFAEGIVDNKNNKITFLIDEPSSSLDIENKLNFWDTVFHLIKMRFQIIVAVHDITPFLLSNDYNLIETEKGFFDKIVKPYLDRVKN